MKGNQNIMILTHWSYQDALIQAYTLPYVYIIRKNLDAGRRIILITFEQKHLKLDEKNLKEKQKFLMSKGIELITFDYTNFNFSIIYKSFIHLFKLTRIIKKYRIGIIHAWCTPAGSIGYILCKLTGVKLIIDSYEPHAEAMVENQTWKKNSIKYHILFHLEKKLTSYASVLISATEGMRKYAELKYNFTPKNFLVKPACVDLSIFNNKRLKNSELMKLYGLENKIVCVYAGKFGGIYLTNEIFRILVAAEKKWGDSFRALLLTNHPREELEKWANETGFNLDKLICKFVSHEDIASYIGLGDFAITPVKPIPTKRFCSPIKDGEYWGIGLPVIITKNISDDSDIIKSNNAGYVLEELTKVEYENAISKIDLLLKSENNLNERISSIAKNYRSYRIAEEVYFKIYSQDSFGLD